MARKRNRLLVLLLDHPFTCHGPVPLNMPPVRDHAGEVVAEDVGIDRDEQRPKRSRKRTLKMPHPLGNAISDLQKKKKKKNPQSGTKLAISRAVSQNLRRCFFLKNVEMKREQQADAGKDGLGHEALKSSEGIIIGEGAPRCFVKADEAVLGWGINRVVARPQSVAHMLLLERCADLNQSPLEFFAERESLAHYQRCGFHHPLEDPEA
jgi:hypothetical protein